MIAVLLLAAALEMGPAELAKSKLSYGAPRMSATIVARTPRFALVRFTNGRLEGDVVSGYLLAQHFAFGWQFVNFTEQKFRLCDLRTRAAAKVDVKAMRAWLRPGEPSKMEGGCGTAERDIGPEADVAAVRRLSQFSLLVPSVRIAGQFALLQWALPGGGMGLYKRSTGSWRMVAGGGGALTRRDLPRYGVPPNVAKVLLDY